MEQIDNLVKRLIETCFVIDKPVNINKENQVFCDEYWKIHGKEICKRKLIKQFSDSKDEYKLQCVINPLGSYLLEPQILHHEKIISALTSF